MKKVDIEKFNGFKVDLSELKRLIKESAEGAKDELAQAKWKRNRRKGTNYNTGWDVITGETKDDYWALVFNETDWQLTWLLEHGHLITNKIGGIGYARGSHVIENAYNNVNKKIFNEALEKVKIELE